MRYRGQTFWRKRRDKILKERVDGCIVKGRFAKFVRNCFPGETIVEGYFVAATKTGPGAA